MVAKDKKVCPFCAEVIKKAAIKCRYCHSDLGELPLSADHEASPAGGESEGEPEIGDNPELEADAEPESDSEPASGSEPESDSDEVPPEGAEEKTKPGLDPSLRLTVLLGILAVGCAAFFGWSVVESNTASPGGEFDGTLVDRAARSALMQQASDAAGELFAYSYLTFDADVKKAKAASTEDFAEEYQTEMLALEEKVKERQISVRSLVLASAIIEATETEAKVLVYVDQGTTLAGENPAQDPQSAGTKKSKSGGKSEPKKSSNSAKKSSAKKEKSDEAAPAALGGYGQSRLVMTMVRDGGDWLVSAVDAF